MTLVKTVERTIFDREKIGIGDIVEFTERHRISPFSRYKEIRKSAIVDRVDDDCLWIYTADKFDHPELERYGLPISRADEITLIRRARP